MRDQIKSVLRGILHSHLPVVALNRQLFAALYKLHCAGREMIGLVTKFFWYEPLFRSQCASVGRRFRMEQLPYLVGSGSIHVGADVTLSGKSSFVFSSRHVDEPTLTIGDGTFIGHNCAIVVGRRVKIGKHCLIAGGVRISDFDGHPINALDRRNGLPTHAANVSAVTIGDDTWLGHGAIILKGVRIGDRAIVGARAVVTKDVPADTIVAGNPARVVKTIRHSIDCSTARDAA